MGLGSQLETHGWHLYLITLHSAKRVHWVQWEECKLGLVHKWQAVPGIRPEMKAGSPFPSGKADRLKLILCQSEAWTPLQACAITCFLSSMLPLHAHSSRRTVGSSQQPATPAASAIVVIQMAVAKSVDGSVREFALQAALPSQRLRVRC